MTIRELFRMIDAAGVTAARPTADSMRNKERLLNSGWPTVRLTESEISEIPEKMTGPALVDGRASREDVWLRRARAAGENNWYIAGFTVGEGGWFAWVDIILPAERILGLRLLDESDLLHIGDQ